MSGLLLAGTIAAVVAAPRVAGAAAAEALWLKLPGLLGDARVDDHANEIVLLSYSQSFTNPVSPFGGGGSSGEANCGSVKVTKAIDRSSPGLISRVLNGTPIAEAVIAFRSSRDNFDYYRVTLKQVRIESITQADASAGDTARILEVVTLVPEAFRFQYVPDPRSAAGSVTFMWNCKENKEG